MTKPCRGPCPVPVSRRRPRGAWPAGPQTSLPTPRELAHRGRKNETNSEKSGMCFIHPREQQTHTRRQKTSARSMSNVNKCSLRCVPTVGCGRSYPRGVPDDYPPPRYSGQDVPFDSNLLVNGGCAQCKSAHLVETFGAAVQAVGSVVRVHRNHLAIH